MAVLGPLIRATEEVGGGKSHTHVLLGSMVTQGILTTNYVTSCKFLMEKCGLHQNPPVLSPSLPLGQVIHR